MRSVMVGERRYLHQSRGMSPHNQQAKDRTKGEGKLGEQLPSVRSFLIWALGVYKTAPFPYFGTEDNNLL